MSKTAEMDPLSQLLKQLRFSADVFLRADYCGQWAVDTGGSEQVPFHLVCQGEGWLHGEDPQPRRLIAGQLVLFPRDSHHVLSVSATRPPDEQVNQPPPARITAPATRLMCGYFRFDQGLARPFLESLPDTMVLDLSHAAQGRTRELVNLWMQEAAVDDFGADLAVDRLAELVFIQMVRQEIASGSLQGLLGALGDARIGPLLAAIHGAPGEPHHLPLMAERAGMSESALAQRFKKLVGLSPGQYIKRWRLSLAAQMLRETERSMAAIAESVGYESEAAFRKAFKQQFSVAPGSYRRQSQLNS